MPTHWPMGNCHWPHILKMESANGQERDWRGSLDERNELFILRFAPRPLVLVILSMNMWGPGKFVLLLKARPSGGGLCWGTRGSLWAKWEEQMKYSKHNFGGKLATNFWRGTIAANKVEMGKTCTMWKEGINCAKWGEMRLSKN